MTTFSKPLILNLVFCLAFCNAIISQNTSSDFFQIATSNSTLDWTEIKPELQLSLKAFLAQKATLGLSPDDGFLLLKTQTDELGKTHYRYQQTYKNIPVAGAQLLVHIGKSGFVETANGRLIRNLQGKTTPAFSAEKALKNYALPYMNAQEYAWENEAHQKMIQGIKKDSKATFYPKGKLEWASSNLSDRNPNNYHLTYQMDIYALRPLKNVGLHINAQDGTIVHESTKIYDIDFEATGETNYTCINSVEFHTQNYEDENQVFTLDNDIGGGIHTYKLTPDGNSTSPIFNFGSNNWVNKKTAVEVHWAMEQTYDYLLNKHNHNSLDGDEMPIIGVINAKVNEGNTCNAWWNSTLQRVFFGNGTSSCSNNSPTSPDLVSHELTHGVTQFSAGLLYEKEPGALNESFSDIFGVLVHFEIDPECANWVIGDEVYTYTGGIRDLSNPKGFDQPDTYLGCFWNSTNEDCLLSMDTGCPNNNKCWKDHYGVHTNSSVQNYWFYLLAEGGNGKNDHDYNYAITGIGKEKAAEIAYRNLTVYLGPTSDYTDARAGSLQAADDLYGIESIEYQTVLDAWCAVGVGGTETCAVLEASLQLLTPNNSPSWKAGTIESILWNSEENETDDIMNVRIEYSLNGGASWQTIVEGTPDDGNFDWQIPLELSTTTAKIRITATNDPTIRDESKTTFCIEACNIVAGFEVEEGVYHLCIGESINFDNTTNNADNYEWRINETTIATTTNFSHTFNSEGTFSIDLIAMKADGCVDNFCETIVVAESANANFHHEQNDSKVNFSAVALEADTYTWNFGDNTEGNGNSLSHRYAEEGNYTVCLTVTDQCGSEQVCKTIYVTTILPLNIVGNHQKISDLEGNFLGELNDSDNFGSALANIGDLDNDGVEDVVVGASGDNDGGNDRGAIWVLFMNLDGTVKTHQKISAASGGFTGILQDEDKFGSSVANIGDLDDDGIIDIAVGAFEDDDGGTSTGAVWILFLNTNGTVKSQQKISNIEGGFTGNIDDGDDWGISLANLGDFDADGNMELAVGARYDDDGDTNSGAVWVLFLNDDGTVKDYEKISNLSGMESGDFMGYSIAYLGDIDGDQITDIAVGMTGDDDGGLNVGAVWILFLNQDASVKDTYKISSALDIMKDSFSDYETFGSSIVNMGDVDGDTHIDLAVGAIGDDDGGSGTGAVWILLLNEDGSLKAHKKISNQQGGFTGTLNGGDAFGTGLTLWGDANGDGHTDLMVGASGDNDGGTSRGATWLLPLNSQSICETDLVQFTYSINDLEATYGIAVNNTDVNNTFHWDFGDGNVSTAQNPVHEYCETDTYTVCLEINNECLSSPIEQCRTIVVIDPNEAIKPGYVNDFQKITQNEGGFAGSLGIRDDFGNAVADIGDLDGDGVGDVVVGNENDDDGGSRRGSVWILFLNADKTVKSHQKISDTEGNFTGELGDNDYFGSSVSKIGDLDNDGIIDIAVGAEGNEEGFLHRGAVWILFLNNNGTVKFHQKITTNQGGFSNDVLNFGSAVTHLGDLDGDNIEDIAVGDRIDLFSSNHGTVWILFLNTNGTVKNYQKITQATGGFTGLTHPYDGFGSSLANIGDFDGDNIVDIAVGAPSASETEDDIKKGAVWFLYLNTNGTVKGHDKINNVLGDCGENITAQEGFGGGVTNVGDIDGNGTIDIAVGEYLDDQGGGNYPYGGDRSGSIYILHLNNTPEIIDYQKISTIHGGFSATLEVADFLGKSLSFLGDIDNDGYPELIGGTENHGNYGAVWILSLHDDDTENTNVNTDIYWVTNTNDSGEGSLRSAILWANSTAGTSKIFFNIPGSAPHIIQPNSPLPDLIDDGTIIDGSTQPNFTLGDIEIDGSNIQTNNARGFELYGADYCEIYGLYIHSFNSDGIGSWVLSRFTIIGAENRGNVISNNGDNIAFRFDGSAEATIQYNLIGTDITGTMENSSGDTFYEGIYMEASDVLIQHNIISGHAAGIALHRESTNNFPINITIRANKIGTDITGTIAIPNGYGSLSGAAGVSITSGNNVTIGGPNLEDANLISGNIAGIDIGGISIDNIHIIGNHIGLDSNGNSLGNTYGVEDYHSGSALIEKNTIAYNVYGLRIFCKSDMSTSFSQNSIYCNANNYICNIPSPPVITSASLTTIEGTAEANDIIEVFISDNSDCVGKPCQGKTYLGTTTVGANGNWSLEAPFEVSLTFNDQITANATDTNQKTSAFSSCKTITNNIYLVTNTNDSGTGSLREAISWANSTDGVSKIHFNIPGSSPHVIQPNSPLPNLTDDGTIIDGSTQPNFTLGDIEIDGSNGGGSYGLHLYGADYCEVYGLYIHNFGSVGIRSWTSPARFTIIGAKDKGNVISNNGNYNIYFNFDGSAEATIQYNLIGTDITGTESYGNGSTSYTGIYMASSDVLIQHNTISGHAAGIFLKGQYTDDFPSNITIRANKIGTDITGTDAIPNGYGNLSGAAGIGIRSGKNIIIGGTNPEDANLISGNVVGISIAPWDDIENVHIIGNQIGLSVNKTPLGNSYGVESSQEGHGLIEKNTIAHNNYGLRMLCNSGMNTTLSQNSIYCNTINYFCNSITYSDQPPPSITSAATNIIIGTAEANDAIEVFISDNDDCTGKPCQGRTYLGTTTADANGNWSLAAPFEALVVANQQVTANSTDANNKTSNFATCQTVVLPLNCAVAASFTYPSNICEGDEIAFINTSNNASSFQWQINGNSYSNLPNFTHTFGDAGTYTLTLVAEGGDGCEYTYTQNIVVRSSVNNIVLDLGGNQYLCNNQALLTAGISDMQNYTWWLGELDNLDYLEVGSGLTFEANTTGNYVLQVTDYCGNQKTDTLFVLLDDNCVWPGDFNYDGVVNVYDLLPYGVHFGATGSTRQNSSLNWLPQPCLDWNGETTEYQSNLKHLDGNGNGVVEGNDKTAILQNYSKEHGISNPLVVDNSIVLGLEPSSQDDDILQDHMSTYIVDLDMHKDLANEVTAYGLAFTLKYNFGPANVMYVHLNLDESWLGNTNTDLQYLTHWRKDDGEIDIAITRTNHQGRTGSGSLGILEFMIDNYASGDEITPVLHAQNVQLSSSVGNLMSIHSESQTHTLYAPPCLDEINISYNGSDFIRTFTQGPDSIQIGNLDNTNNLILPSGKRTHLQAKKNIEILPGTEIKHGSIFGAIIGDCEIEGGKRAEENTEIASTPNELQLQIAPNPFSQRTTIDYFLPTDSPVNLTIYDIYGRVVQHLVRYEDQKAGRYRLKFKPCNMAVGVYICKLELGDEQVTVRLVKSN